MLRSLTRGALIEINPLLPWWRPMLITATESQWLMDNLLGKSAFGDPFYHIHEIRSIRKTLPRIMHGSP
jgi:hypothetical protein